MQVRKQMIKNRFITVFITLKKCLVFMRILDMLCFYTNFFRFNDKKHYEIMKYKLLQCEKVYCQYTQDLFRFRRTVLFT